MKAIITKYIGPTNTRGTRIKASDMDGNHITVPYDDAARGPHKAAVLALCRKMGWRGTLVWGATNKGYAFVFLPHDTAYAVRCRFSSEVLDLSKTDEELLIQ